MLMKSILAAGAIAAALFTAQPQAEAGTRIGVSIGVGEGVQFVHGRRSFRRAPFYGRRGFRAQRRASRRRAFRSLRRRGYYDIDPRGFRRGDWRFTARKRGRLFRLRVDGRTGAIVRRHRIRAY